MTTVRIGGANVPLPTFPGLANQTAGIGVPGQSGYYTGLTNAVSLQAGEVWMFPSGTYLVTPGPYTFLQWLDPWTNRFKVWPTYQADGTMYIISDGTNYRLANLTGCAVSATITDVGASGTSWTNGIGATATGLTVTASSGASTWVPIIGGAVATTAVTGTAGSGYLYPPIVIVDAPPQGGLQATAIVTSLSNGTVPAANIQVLNQGAGYTTAPNLTFVNDARDTAGSGAAATVTLTGTGTLTGLYPSNHGTALTGVPTLSFSTGTAAATVIMNFTVTGFTTGAGGGGADIAVGAELVSTAHLVAAQASPLNPLHVSGITFPRPARITAGVAGNVITVTGSTTGQLTVVEDGGLGIQVVPALQPIVSFTQTTGTLGAAQFTATVGGVSDTSYIQPV